MMRWFLLVLCLLTPVSCAGSAREDYEQGEITPFAQQALAASEPAGAPAAPSPDEGKFAKIQAHLSALEVEWRAREAAGLARPSEFGLQVAEVTKDGLRTELTLPKVLGAAYTMSPAIRASRDALRATIEQFDQVAFLDTILRQYRTFTRDLDLRIGAPLQKEMVESHFPFPGTLSLKTTIVAADAEAAGERLGKMTRETLVAAGQGYFEYAYLGEAVRIVTENIELLRGIVRIAESKYGVGKAGQSVVLRLHVEIASLEDRLVTLQERSETERSRLNSLLGLEADFPLGQPDVPDARKPVATPGPLYPLALEHRQEIRAIRAKIEGAQALIELAETKASPDLSLGYSRFEEKGMTRVGGARMVEPFSENPTQSPKYWFGESASFIEEMKQRLKGMKADLENLQFRTEYQVKDAWFKWDAAYRQVELHRTSLLPQAEQSRLKLLRWDLSPDQITALEERGTPAKVMTWRSPFDGVVVHKNVVEGAYFKPGEQRYRIASLDTVWVYASIYEFEFPWVEVGQTARMQLPYFPGETFQGTVEFIYPYLDPKTRDRKVRLIFENPGYELVPDMFSTVYIDARLADQATLVPSEAVLDTGVRHVVFVAAGKGKFDPRDVRVGIRSKDGLREVLSGLVPGERVVTSGQFLLDSESKIKEAIQKMLSRREGGEKPAPVKTPKDGPAAATDAKPRFTAPPGMIPIVAEACPVMGGKPVPEVYADYGRYRVFFCCTGCPDRFRADPEKYLEKLRRMGAIPADDDDAAAAPTRYTCPMDPEVVQDPPGKCPECGMKLIPVKNEEKKEAGSGKER